VSFDPFGDFETRGYLRNFQGLKDPEEIQRLEHIHFLENLDSAIEHLKHVDQISYQDVLDTHKILFRNVYPWAGQDRQTTAPDKIISKAGRSDLFAHPGYAQDAVQYALRLGQFPTFMAEHPGEVMGYLAHGHPFLDGNGRTIILVHNELAHRAGIAIDWTKTDQQAYLLALTRELDRPGKGELDEYLKPFVRPAFSHAQASADLTRLSGLGPQASQGEHEKSEMTGRVEDPKYNEARKLDPAQFAVGAAELLSANQAAFAIDGREQLIHLEKLAAEAGYEIDRDRIDPAEWSAAFNEAYYTGDQRPMRNVIVGALVEREADPHPVHEQEQSDSRESALDDSPTTAEKDAKDFEASLTSGELSDDKQAKMGRLSNELKPDTGSTPDQGQGKDRPQGGGRSRGRR
jgi:cell filamentation protein, protein adenylyltransferase